MRIDIDSHLAWNQRYSGIKAEWKASRPLVIEAMDSDERAKVAYRIVFPIMEGIQTLEDSKKTGKLRKRADWKDIHRMFFGNLVDDKNLGMLVGNFYHTIRHVAIQEKELLDFKIADNDGNSLIDDSNVVFQIMYIDHRLVGIQVNHSLFLQHIIAGIENFLNGEPIQKGITPKLFSEIKGTISDKPLPIDEVTRRLS